MTQSITQSDTETHRQRHKDSDNAEGVATNGRHLTSPRVWADAECIARNRVLAGTQASEPIAHR